MSAEINKSKKLYSIQTLRFFAAIFVVIFHSHNVIMRHISNHHFGSVDRAYEVGAAGVHIFFVISGFVMAFIAMQPNKNIPWTAFIRRRLLRIYPIYWLIAISSIIVNYELGSPYNISIYQFAGAMLLIPQFSSYIVGPGWTLSYEIFFYILFGICLIFPKKSQIFALSGMLIFLIILGVISSRMRSILGICANPINLEFLAGSWLGFAYVRGHRLKFGISITLIGLGVAMLMLSYFLIQRGISTVPLWGIPALCIVSGMVHAENRRDFSSVSKIAALGDASYFLYLSHILLLTIMNKLLPLNIPDFVFLTSSTCLVWALFCVAISRIGHLVIELPLIGALQDHKFRNKVSIK